MTTQPLSALTMLLSRHTRRREFITLLGGAAAWPLAASAQQSGVRTIGFLGQSTRSAASEWTAAFVQRLRDDRNCHQPNNERTKEYANDLHDASLRFHGFICQFDPAAQAPQAATQPQRPRATR